MGNSLSLIKRYHKEVSPQILAGYQDAPKSIWVNIDDKDLIPIEIKLPLPPEPHLIDNWGIPAEKQMFKPPKLLRRLKELQRKFETLDEIWEELEVHQDIYAEEIEFIKLQWKRRLYGYWFYNNGVPTYIDGWHYFYCAWWHIDIGLPDYKERDRKFFLFARKIQTETISPRVDEEGFAKRDDKGNCDWYDFKKRLFYGFIYPKHRREGATYKGECINYEIISRTINARGGIQSMNDDKSKICFLRHLVAPWKKLPFFFKPNYEGSTSPKTELSFTPPAKRLSSKGALMMAELGLESGVDFGNADETAYEGTKLYFHHDDEIGRLKKGVSCLTRHEVVKECLVDGADIIGFTVKTSTVGEMEKGGGKDFKALCKLSDYYERTPNGQTPSGLAVLFIPAYEGLKGFIDQYGISIVGNPTKAQANYTGYKIGAREFLLNRRKGYLSNQDSLSGEIRLYPMRLAECFRTSQKSSGFNMLKLEGYIDDMELTKQPVARGNFAWKDNEKDTKVEFVLNKNGKFRVSHQFNEVEANRKYWSDDAECWMPGNAHWGVAGGDPFKFNKTAGNRKSKGGGAVIRKGQLKDGDFSMKRKFVCTYAVRMFDKAVYGEDMLMMCIYYGVKMFPEINVPYLWDYFTDRGYAGYLRYKIDPKTFEFSKTPGGSSSEKLKQDIFTEWMTWIENEADEETHIEILEECRDIDGPEDMTNYDLFTAGGYALLGTHSVYDEAEEFEEAEYSLDSFLVQHTYSSKRKI